MTKKRTASSARWLAEHESDAYVQQARKRGYRSRAWFKLEEIDAKDRIIKRGMNVVDLGAAPGSWCQYVQKRFAGEGRLVALDILPMEPLPGVDFILGDFRADEVLAELQASVGVRGTDLVLSDMAPNMSGNATADQMASIYLAELALAFACDNLREGGALLCKLFSGEGIDDFIKQVKQHFAEVAVRKPKASRNRSRELYLLARKHRVV